MLVWELQRRRIPVYRERKDLTMEKYEKEIVLIDVSLPDRGRTINYFIEVGGKHGPVSAEETHRYGTRAPDSTRWRVFEKGMEPEWDRLIAQGYAPSPYAAAVAGRSAIKDSHQGEIEARIEYDRAVWRGLRLPR